MEVFVDFGLFKLFAATGLAIVARRIYTRRWPALACLTLSVSAPVVLLFLSEKELSRLVATVCLATALINATLIFLLIRRCDMVTLLAKKAPPHKLKVPAQVEE